MIQVFKVCATRGNHIIGPALFWNDFDHHQNAILAIFIDRFILSLHNFDIIIVKIFK